MTVLSAVALAMVMIFQDGFESDDAKRRAHLALLPCGQGFLAA